MRKIDRVVATVILIVLIMLTASFIHNLDKRLRVVEQRVGIESSR